MQEKKYWREYYELNKETIVKQQLEYQKNNIEELRKYRREYYRKYYATHREEIYAKRKQYYRTYYLKKKAEKESRSEEKISYHKR